MTKKEKYKPLVFNKKAGFDYIFFDRFEAGIVLKGGEIKSLRAGGANLKDSYIAFRKNEAYLQNSHISSYKHGVHFEPKRVRKLLLNRNELNKIQGSLQKKGLTCVPIKIYLKNQKAKVEIALAQGKKKWDKREALKKKSQKREIQRHLRK